MNNYIAAFIWIAVILFSFLIRNYRKYEKQFALYKLVSWVVDDNDYNSRTYLISDAQDKFVSEPEYRIETDEEWNVVKEIITAVKNKTSEYYFKGYLSVPKSVPKTEYHTNFEVYFLYLLHNFLKEHQCESRVLGNDMHNKTLKYEDFGSWGAPLYDATYELSDFAITFYKLYLITHLYCTNNQVISSSVTIFNKEESIKTIIDSKTISISRM